MFRPRVSSMRFDRWLAAGVIACSILGPAHGGTKRTCKTYLAKHVTAIGVLPQVTGLDLFVADPENPALRKTTVNMLGYQEIESLQALAERISAAYDRRDDCVGDVGRKITVDDTAVDPAEFIATIEKLHDHALPLLSAVLDERTAGSRAQAERARLRAELTALSDRWEATIAALAEARADGPTDPATVEELRAALDAAKSPAARCFVRAGLLRVRPLGDDLADDLRAFESCLDLPEDTTPREYETWIRDQGFLGAVDARDRALRAGSPERAIRWWTALLEVFGGQPDGAWTEAAYGGIPDDVREMATAATDLGWPTRSRIELGLYCMVEQDAGCVETQFALGGDRPSDAEPLLASIADRLGDAGDPRAVELWKYLEANGTQETRYLQDRVRFAIAHDLHAELRDEVSETVARGNCERATWMLSRIPPAGSDPVAHAELLLPCTADTDEGTADAAWEVIGEAYRDVLRARMLADPPRLGEAVGLARRALEIPEAYRESSVTDYARYVLEVADRRASGTVDPEQVRRDRFDGCTQTLAAIEWKRRREDASYIADLESLRTHCCSFLLGQRAEWVAWMESGAEATDDRGRTTTRQFSPEEIANKQSGLARYCSEP